MHVRRLPVPSLLALCVLAASFPALAAAGSPPQPGWQPEWNLRLRHETVDHDGFGKGADATTARLRAGFRGTFGGGLSALLEGEGIAAAGVYDSGANGRVDRPLIADAPGVELNQAWLGWERGGAQAWIGRQRLLLGNQRWVGNSGWRQNEQTFDALSMRSELPADMAVAWAWIGRVHRVSGDGAHDRLARERRLDTHAVELDWRRGKVQLGVHALLHEDRDVPGASTATSGMRASVGGIRDGRGWNLALEWAEQRDHAGNPRSFTHRYWRLEPAIALGGVTWRAGVEQLGGDGRHALQTPLATLHAFNGWADQFGTTPPAGLQDRYLGAAGEWNRAGAGHAWNWSLAWHDYRADAGHLRYGREWNASLGFPLGRSAKGLFKLAGYRADGYARDQARAWLQLEWAR